MQRVEFPRRLLWSAADHIEAAGRAVAMDIGLGSFVEKVEEYCGKQIARWFIILMVLAVSVFCMKAIWDNLVEPSFKLSQTPVWGRTIGAYTWFFITLVAGVASGSALAASFGRWRRVKQLNSIIAKAEALMDKTQEQHDRHVTELRDATAQGEEMLEAAFATIRQTDKLQGKSKEVLGLLLYSARRTVLNDPEMTQAQRVEAAERFEEYERLMEDLEKDNENEGE